MSRNWKSGSPWRWCVVFALGLFLASVWCCSPGVVSAEETDAEQDFVDEDGDGFEDIDPEKATDPKEKEKPKRLTRAERAAKKKAEKKAKQREKQIGKIASRLGKRKDGYFVVALQTKKFVMPHKGNKPVPTLKFDVVAKEGRRAAAEKILEHMLDIERQTPKRRGASSLPPPEGKYILVGRFDDADEAYEQRQESDEDYQELVKKHEDRLRKKLKQGGGGRGPGGNPL